MEEDADAAAPEPPGDAGNRTPADKMPDIFPFVLLLFGNLTDLLECKRDGIEKEDTLLRWCSLFDVEATDVEAAGAALFPFEFESEESFFAKTLA